MLLLSPCVRRGVRPSRVDPSMALNAVQLAIGCSGGAIVRIVTLIVKRLLDCLACKGAYDRQNPPTLHFITHRRRVRPFPMAEFNSPSSRRRAYDNQS